MLAECRTSIPENNLFNYFKSMSIVERPEYVLLASFYFILTALLECRAVLTLIVQMKILIFCSSGCIYIHLF